MQHHAVTCARVTRISVIVGLTAVFLATGAVRAGAGIAVSPTPDVNGDGAVTSIDLAIVGQCLGQNPLTNASCANADVDHDGDIDLTDANIVAAFMRTRVPSRTATRTATRTPSRAASATATSTATSTPVPIATATHTATRTPTSTPTATPSA